MHSDFQAKIEAERNDQTGVSFVETGSVASVRAGLVLIGSDWQEDAVCNAQRIRALLN